MAVTMKAHRSIIEFLALKKNVVALLAMVILVGMGEKMAERFLPVYLIALGGGVLSVGFLNGLDNLLGALYAFPGGYLSERIGYKRALLFFNLVAMVGFLVVILVPKWYAVIAGAVLFLSWSAISLPASMDLISKTLPLTKRTMGVTMHSLVRRIPMALGPVVGGAFIQAFGIVKGIHGRLAKKEPGKKTLEIHPWSTQKYVTCCRDGYYICLLCREPIRVSGNQTRTGGPQ